MKKFLSLFLIASLWTNAFAQGDPAPYIKGSGQSGLGNIGSTVIVPNQQSTKINSYQARIETGNDNLLSNPSFESNVSGTGWTAVNGACVASSGVTVDGITNCLFTSSGISWSLLQSSTTNAARLAGQEMEGSIWVGSASTTDPIWLCPYVDSVALTASVANGCMQYTNIGKPQLLKVYFLGGTTSNGIRVSGANSATAVGLDAAYAGLRTNSEVSGQINTPWASCGHIAGDFNGFGTPSLIETQCRRMGPNLEMKGKFTTASSSAVEARLNLKLNGVALTSDGTVSIPSIQIVGKGNNTTISTNRFSGMTILAEPSVGYVTMGIETSSVGGLTKVNGNDIISSGSVSFFSSIPIAGWQNNINAFSTKCDDPRQCETVFSASVSNTGSISAESLDFISGNASLSTATFTGTWTSGVFTLAPNCTASISNTVGTTTNNLSIPISTTASGFTVNTVNNQTASAQPFIIVCQKRGADYDNSRITQQIVQMRGVPTVPGATGGIGTFSTAYGGVSISTVCASSSTCTLYNQIGTGISSITQGAAGLFTVNFSRTYAKINCTATTISASTVAPPVNSGATPPMSCSNCSSLAFATGNPASSYVNTYGTINCQGEY